MNIAQEPLLHTGATLDEVEIDYQEQTLAYFIYEEKSFMKWSAWAYR